MEEQTKSRKLGSFKRTQPVSRKISNDTSKSSASQPINIAVVGDRNVGKSALTVRFITKRYIGEYMSGDRHNYSYNYLEDNKSIVVNFRDEASIQEQKENLSIQLSCENVSWADAVIMVYDVGEPSSFLFVKEAIRLMKENLQREGNDAGILRWKPVLVLGNKTDIIRRRQVQESDVKEAAKRFPSWVCCDQVSAAENYETIAEQFNHLIARVRQHRRLVTNKAKVGILLRNRSLKPKCHEFIKTQQNSLYESCKS